MDRRSWLWRKKSSERSPGETESSGSVSSLSEKFFDDQDMSRASPTCIRSPEVSSDPSGCEINENLKVFTKDNDNVRALTEKLSAAFLNIRTKEDLVKQHAKVAEEAVTGWEKAEKEAAILKQQFEAASQKNKALEERVSHLDAALKECLRQLRQARDEQEQRIHEALVNHTREFEYSKIELEKQVTELQIQVETAKSEISSSLLLEFQPTVEALERENSALKTELLTQAEELKHRTLERDLCMQTAEMASKQRLESVKNVSKLEAECRRLRFMTRKASLRGNDHRQMSSFCVESLTDSQSDNGDRSNQIEVDIQRMRALELNEGEPSCSDSWASSLIAEHDQFKHGKASGRSITGTSMEMGLMDDFLEMERLAVMYEIKAGSCYFDVELHAHEYEGGTGSPVCQGKETILRSTELEELQRLQDEKKGLEQRLAEAYSQLEILRIKSGEADERLLQLEREVDETKSLKNASDMELEMVNATMKMVELQLQASGAEVQALKSNIDSLKMDIEQERVMSAGIKVKCSEVHAKLEQEKALLDESTSRCQKLEVEIEHERMQTRELQEKIRLLEDKVYRKSREAEIHREAASNCEQKMFQDKEFAAASGKLAECQQTIASLGRQLHSLVTLEDFLLDPGMPEFNGVSSALVVGETVADLNDLPSSRLDYSKLLGSGGKSSESSLSSPSRTAEKTRNGIGKLFIRSRIGPSVESH